MLDLKSLFCPCKKALEKNAPDDAKPFCPCKKALEKRTALPHLEPLQEHSNSFFEGKRIAQPTRIFKLLQSIIT